MGSSNVLNSKEPLTVVIEPNIADSFAQDTPKALQDPLQVPVGPIKRARAK
ncbi:hypothetical protein J1N35_025440 [Gossypium stocksii]|uniref:Uncharacterized protein n=1 Tax=Gossypium stocksii TaxID=47602 RepID=A0A9D3ZX53_9ROSI|nr:hypothetical protein J1N35_025440 [Gossypium stocksii]